MIAPRTTQLFKKFLRAVAVVAQTEPVRQSRTKVDYQLLRFKRTMLFVFG